MALRVKRLDGCFDGRTCLRKKGLKSIRNNDASLKPYDAVGKDTSVGGGVVSLPEKQCLNRPPRYRVETLHKVYKGCAFGHRSSDQRPATSTTTNVDSED